MFKNVLCSALILGTSLCAAMAAEARIPIYTTTTITSPGTYFLSRGLSGPGPLIRVEANDVDIDLNGFTLSPTSGAGLLASGVDRVAVHDGFITGGQASIRLDAVEGARLERLGTDAAGDASLQIVNSTGVVVRDVIVRGAGQEGILVDGAGLADPAQIEISGSQIVGSGDAGISLVNTGSSLVKGNTINAVIGRGISVDGGRAVQIEGNAIRETGMAGIALLSSTGCQVVENVVRFTTTDGIIVDSGSTDNTVTGNQVTAGSSYGLRVGGDRNVIELNLLGGNANWGLYFNANANDNVFRTNVARGNTGGACAGGTNGFCDQGANNTSAGDNFAPTLL